MTPQQVVTSLALDENAIAAFYHPCHNQDVSSLMVIPPRPTKKRVNDVMGADILYGIGAGRLGTSYRSQPSAQGQPVPRDVGLVRWRLGPN